MTNKQSMTPLEQYRQVSSEIAREKYEAYCASRSMLGFGLALYGSISELQRTFANSAYLDLQSDPYTLSVASLAAILSTLTLVKFWETVDLELDITSLRKTAKSLEKEILHSEQ